MQITLKTLTPLWTGGVDGRSNRPQETGVIGSLRWWYEAIVRGLGGYVGDPTSSNKAKRSEFDSDAYQQALRRGLSKTEALVETLKSLGAVEYLFGTTGWARLFRLRTLTAPRVPLHFRTTAPINKNWLGRVFQGKEEQGYTIDELEVLYGDIEFLLAFRGYDVSFAQKQLALLFHFVEAYGGLGARLQHGFGQIGNLALPEKMAQMTIEDGLQALKAKLDAQDLRRDGATAPIPYNLNNFFHQVYGLPESAVYRFTRPDTHFGNPKMQDEIDYLPCAFDLRYKGDGNLGFRRWLKEEKGWTESDAPPPLGRLDQLMGPRSQWENRSGRTVSIQDELRTASRVCFGMPVKAGGDYELAIFGFAPPDILPVEELCDLCSEYMRLNFGTDPIRQELGRDVIAQATGGAK